MRLKQQVQALRIEIDEGKKASVVSAVVDTDAFQNLRARAQEMRDRRQKWERPPGSTGDSPP